MEIMKRVISGMVDTIIAIGAIVGFVLAMINYTPII